MEGKLMKRIELYKTIKDITKEYNISRMTIYMWRIKGLVKPKLMQYKGRPMWVYGQKEEDKIKELIKNSKNIKHENNI